MQIKRLAMYEFNKPKIACNKCRDNKTNVQFTVIGRLEKPRLGKNSYNSNSKKTFHKVDHQQTFCTHRHKQQSKLKKKYKHLQTKRKYNMFGYINTYSVLMPNLDAVQLRFYLGVFFWLLLVIYMIVFSMKSSVVGYFEVL